MTLKNSAAALLAALALTGCALSPQTVTLAPTLVVAPESIGKGHTVKVLATDTRANAVIGTRSGVYAKTSEIRSDNDVAEAVRKQVIAGLAAQGYTDAGDASETTIRLRLTELAYRVPEGAIATSADITVAIEATAERAGSKQTGTYRSEVHQRFPVAPSPEQNEAWLNEALNETLQRFFDDAAMRAFLAK